MAKSRGRPTKYKKSYGKALIKHCENGGWAMSFCGEIGISRDTFYAWIKKYPYFSDTYKIARQKSQLWYAKLLRQQALGRGPGSKGNLGAIIWIMKNCHGWTDRPVEVEDPIEELEFYE